MRHHHDASDDDDAPGADGPREEVTYRSGAETAQPKPGPGRAIRPGAKPAGGTSRARGIAAVVLVAMAAVLSFTAVPALYLHNEVLDTDRYAAIVGPLAADPAVQAEITDKVTAQIIGAVDIEGAARDAVADLGSVAPRAAAAIAGFAPVLAEQTKTLIHTTVANFVASPQFQTLWTQTNRVAHEAIVNLAAGNTDGAVSIDEQGAVMISTKEIIARVKTLLVDQGVAVAARIPEVETHITLFQSPGLVRAAAGVAFVDRAAPVLAWLTVLSAVAAIAIAPRGARVRATGRIGLAWAASMGVLALTLAVGVNMLLGTITPSALSPAAAQSLVDAFLPPLRTDMRFVAVVGLLIAAAAFPGGHPRAAESVRQGLRRAADYVARKAESGRPRPWQHRLARLRRGLEAAVLGVAVLVLVLGQRLTAATAILTALLAGLSVLLIELLCRPALDLRDRHAAASDGEPAGRRKGQSIQ